MPFSVKEHALFWCGSRELLLLPLAFGLIQEILGGDDGFTSQLLELFAHLAAKISSRPCVLQKLRHPLALIALVQRPGSRFRKREHIQFDIGIVISRIFCPSWQLFHVVMMIVWCDAKCAFVDGRGEQPKMEILLGTS